MENAKYKILKGKPLQYRYSNLYRIQALKDIGKVKKGTLGGYIEKESNLSQEGDAWVHRGAIVCNNAQILDNAQIEDYAEVFGEARVFGNAKVRDYAWVHGEAEISDNAIIFGKAQIYGNKISSDEEVNEYSYYHFR